MRRVWIGLALLLTLVCAALVALRVPYANGPSEWRWEYRPATSTSIASLWAAVAGVLALVVAWLGARGGFAMRRGVVAGGILGSALSLAVVAAQPGGFDRVFASLLSRQVFGYLWDAGVAPSSSELLADYPAASRGLSMHSVTHPPGPILCLRALDGAVRGLAPAAPVAGASGLGSRAAAAIDTEVRRAREHGRPVPETPPQPWTVVFLAVALPMLGAGVVWPLAALGKRWGLDREALSCATALWLLVPARTVFTPSLDQVLPLFVVGAAALALGPRWGVLAGGVLAGLAVLLSYGCLPWVPMLAASAWIGATAPDAWTAFADRRRWTRAALFLAGAAAPALLLAAAAGFDLVAAPRSALALHRLMAVVTRSYSTWLVWNPYDFALLVGPGVACLAVLGLRAGGRRSTAAWHAAVLAGGLAVLWIAGTVRGEVGRIWLFFMPCACLAAGRAVRGAGERGALLAAQGLLLFALAASLVFVS